MTWVTWAIIALMLVAILAGLLLIGRLPRAMWEPIGAALLFGLAGYAWQGAPGLRGEPRSASQTAPRFDEEMAKMRNSFGGQYGQTAQWLTLSDGYARQGRTQDAVAILSSALRAQPAEPMLWVGMGNALVSHGEGLISPSAEYSYEQAMRLDPKGAAAPYFYGLALATSGQFDAARKIWAALLERMPERAPLHAQLVDNLAKLDQLRAMQAGAVEGAAPPAGAATEMPAQ